jgi:hypothetical protein
MKTHTPYTGAFCPECKAVFDDTSGSPWGWRKSQALHENGTGHRMKRFRHGEIDLLALYYDKKLVTL